MTAPLVQSDSRRLTGPNLYLDRPGAVLDVTLAGRDPAAAIAAWEDAVRRLLGAVGWGGEVTAVRRFPGGASLVISAPPDTLYAATEITEWGLLAANAAVTGGTPPPLADAAERIRGLIQAERNPPLLALTAAASAHGVTLLVDADQVSVGTGTGVRCWPVAATPQPDQVNWSAVHDVPTVLVTGSNGKTTTVRLLTAVLTGAGRVTGMCCSDSVNVAGDVLDRGDWSGPGGARLVLRDPRVEVAVLETARGGMLRRGLAVGRADAAIITNIAEDHFGEFGISDLASLAEAKFVVARALGNGGTLVLNADDPELVARAGQVTCRRSWFSFDPANPVVRSHLAAGGTAVVLEGDRVLLLGAGERRPLATLAEVPLTLDGRARHNVANVMGVVALAAALGVPEEAIARTLRRFTGSAEENPGRLNFFTLGGVTAVADFAHNPHGLRALVGLARSLPARRRLVLLGQAGDRDDQAIRELAQSAWALPPDRILLKEMARYLRGRAPGEVTGLLQRELLRLGARPDAIEVCASEFEAVRAALAWATSGDLLVLPVHAERERVLGLLGRLEREGWKPGEPVPS